MHRLYEPLAGKIFSVITKYTYCRISHLIIHNWNSSKKHDHFQLAHASLILVVNGGVHIKIEYCVKYF